MKQRQHLKKAKSSYGGSLLKTREGRQGSRPISVKHSMHLVLRSSLAVGDWSFRRKINSQKINTILKKFSQKYGVKILKLANVGNHIHLHIKLSKRYGYKPFIRAVTSAIAMCITGAGRGKPLKELITNGRFWDRRPFTRIVYGFKNCLRLNDYIEINELEGLGFNRGQAKVFLARIFDEKNGVNST